MTRFVRALRPRTETAIVVLLAFGWSAFGDAIIMTSIAAVLLNAWFNRSSAAEAEAQSMLAAQGAGHI